MYDNILFQNATSLLEKDILSGNLPGSILFTGPQSQGKLSCALETARVLSCREVPKGQWNCTCPSCLRHKAMISPDVLVTGPGNRILEIAAARKTLLTQNVENTSHLDAAQYLYIRAVRKLTVRFSPVLWEGDSNLGKFAPIIQSIEELLEDLKPGKILPENPELTKITDEIQKSCEKLESGYLYDSLPVNQIRNFSSWARLTTSGGKKVLIIENADKMAEASRNALLKILEEPPENTMFILTTTSRGAILPTILSRVRNYTFAERTAEQQKTLIQRLFYYNAGTGSFKGESIAQYLHSFLPCSAETIQANAASFFEKIANGKVPDVSAICSGCLNFNPRIIFRLFLESLLECQRKLMSSACGAESSFKVLQLLKDTYNNVTVYNQTPQNALEELTRSLMQINYVNNGIFRDAISE